MFPYPGESLDDSRAVTCPPVTYPPVGVSVTLPHSVVFLESPRVARWDAASKSGDNVLMLYTFRPVTIDLLYNI